MVNFSLLFGQLFELPGWTFPVALLGLLIYYIYFHIRPRAIKKGTHRLRTLLGGYEILLDCFLVILASTILYVIVYFSGALVDPTGSIPVWVPLLLNFIFAVILIGALLINGFFRVLITCNRLRVVWRILLLLCWWVPIFNIYLFYRVLKAARSEYYFACARGDMETVHAENQDCKTHYPLVLVHGVFFRDWQLVNYWGRIPQALCRCGATIYYGHQQSAAPVARSAEELTHVIRDIVEKCGCEKVNLIAHSKGGLDSRYAISRLGLAPYVASLTTVNTPHRGCIFAKDLLATLPKRVLGQMESKYNAIFHKLGDAHPDFLGGVKDLASDSAEQFNAETPDMDGILYQSVTSTMKNGHSAAFPLNLTWKLVKKHDQEENDGLVARSSAKWGDFLGELTVPGRRGISHGDVIDLMREDIPGFDVREFYINLVRDLKKKRL